MKMMTVEFYNHQENEGVIFHYVDQFSYCEEEENYELYHRDPKTFSGWKEAKVDATTHLFVSAEMKEA